MVNYHNVRDRNGRFTSSGTKQEKRKHKKKGKEVTGILNVFILDDSGSMDSKVSGTVEGFNKILSDGKQASKDNKLANYEALATFGEARNFSWTAGDIKPLTTYNYRPIQGSTALWDAVIKGINRAESYLSILPKNTNVILTIFTDGQNNVGYGLQEDARRLVEEKKKQDWVITYMGAGTQFEAETVAQSIGIFASNSLGYQNTNIGTRDAMNKMSASKVSYMASAAVGAAVADGFFSND